MSSVPRISSRLVLLTVALTACGGEGSPDGGDVAAMPQDTFVKPIVREPLSEADLVGFTMADMALEIPWTRNKITRDPAPGAPPVDIRGADVAGHATFDRVTFGLGEGAAIPGYQVQVMDAGATVSCGTEDRTLDAEHTLVVTLTPARASGEGETWVPTRLRNTSASRMSRAGALCDEGGTVTWVAELGEGDQVRLMELRSPARVVVDVR